MGAIERYHGVLPVIKQSGMSSHDVVNRVRRIVNQQSVGHTGTLDPLATGLLVICLGKATKISQYLMADEKSYTAQIRLGVRSTTYDAEGVTTDPATAAIPEVTRAQIEAILPEFTGSVRQTVPAYSSVQVDGKRLYKIARKGRDVELPERDVEIRTLALVTYAAPFATFDVSCSKGTYIRSLANDIGERLGCGAYLSGLVRTRMGRFDIAEAYSFEQLAQLAQANQLAGMVLPIEAALPWGTIQISERFSQAVSFGRLPHWTDVTGHRGEFRIGDRVMVRDDHAVLAMGLAGVDSHQFDAHVGTPLTEYLRVLA